MNILELHNRFRRYCLVEEGLADTTIRDLKSTIRTFLKRTGAKNISDLNLALVKEFFYEGKELYSWSYYRFINYHKYLKKFFGWCVVNGHMKTNPVLEIKKPKKPQQLPRRLTDEDAQRLLYTTFDYEWRYEYERSRNYAIVATFLYSGLRRSELLNLEVTDINLNIGEILVRHGKGNKDRYVPIHYKLKRILKRYLDDRKVAKKQSQYLFVGSRSNKPLTISGIRGIFKKLRAATGIDVSPHKLRHTFGSTAVEQNVALPKVQQIMGHSNIQSTMIYLRMSSKALSSGLNAAEMF